MENLEKIFEEYNSYSGGQDGSGGGLGLAICKFILNLHQGQVWAESGGNGSTFSFVLPFIQQEAQLAIMSEPPHQLMQAGRQMGPLPGGKSGKGKRREHSFLR